MSTEQAWLRLHFHLAVCIWMPWRVFVSPKLFTLKRYKVWTILKTVDCRLKWVVLTLAKASLIISILNPLLLQIAFLHCFFLFFAFSGISCGDPQPTFNITGGQISNYRLPPFHVGHRLHFQCPESHKLIGSSSRVCQANGQWSGIITSCDLKGRKT